MIIKMFNFWYFFCIFIAICLYFGLYFLLKNKSDKVKKITLASILFAMLALHFLKCFIPPYSLDINRLYRDIFFVNICGANIALFPFFFLSKKQSLKDYMFFVGIISGTLSIVLPLEPLDKANQAKEILDIIRFYIHHISICIIPLLMVTLGLHKISFKRILWVPTIFMCVLLFVMLNQILQSELGFIPLRNNDFLNINYKNSSMIWAPTKDAIAKVFTILCPPIFKTVPVGEFAGQTKYWPWFWLIVPAYVYLTIISFIICMLFKSQRIEFNLWVKSLKRNKKQ